MKKVKRVIEIFTKRNRWILLGMILGGVIGYLYWCRWGHCWGTYAMSAVWWNNVLIGVIVGGGVVSVIQHNN